MIVAVPMPPPTQRLISAVFRSRRSSSSRTVPRIIVPVAPNGCPIAMAPPLTLILSCGMSSRCMNNMTTEANASLSSNRSMSSVVMPQRLKTFSADGAGPVSMMVGSVPIDENPLIFARGARPRTSPASLLPTSIAAAPSTIPLELPPVCT